MVETRERFDPVGRRHVRVTSTNPSRTGKHAILHIVALALLLLVGCSPLYGESETMEYNVLTPEEERVMVHKGTEKPFGGKYHDHAEPGIYSCKRCDAALYPADSKFKSGTGWPSFDEAIPGAVRRQPDPDGQRTEVVCAQCGAHLGHVFLGEGFTPKDTRHCVNSIALEFVPEHRIKRAIFAGGCFWGVEYHFQRVPGVLSTAAGYIGGNTENPTYEDVCRKNTGHAEAVEVVYDPEKVTYETLARLFFEIHDPTQVNRQGPDIGDQYRSAVFYLDDEQRRTAQKLIGILEQKGLDIATAVVPAGRFWAAEDYHQRYYDKTGKEPYCHVRTPRFSP